jgi:hypothetical protein
MTAMPEEIVRALPQLQSQFDENVADNAELLPHLFLGEVSRWANRRAASEARYSTEICDVAAAGLAVGAARIHHVI